VDATTLLSGLTTAFTLGRESPGAKLLVTEARDYVGGNIKSRNENGYIWEAGSSTFNTASTCTTPARQISTGLERSNFMHFVKWLET
jgi:protoporphyrinogen oxidase